MTAAESPCQDATFPAANVPARATPPTFPTSDVHGRVEVRAYWTRQWTMIDPRVEPVEFSSGTEGEIVVEVHAVVRDLGGNLLDDKIVGHVFRIENGLIKRFDIRGT